VHIEEEGLAETLPLASQECMSLLTATSSGVVTRGMPEKCQVQCKIPVYSDSFTDPRSIIIPILQMKLTLR
jgi:hypothetical protein